jgi:aconitate hydratase
MLAAGLLAKKAVEKGLKVNPAVKASLAPGSRVVTDYLEEDRTARRTSNKLRLQHGRLRLHHLHRQFRSARRRTSRKPSSKNDLVTRRGALGQPQLRGARAPEHASRTSSMSPPLVVAFALAGRVDIDLSCEPLGTGKDGAPVYLADIWPTLAGGARRDAGRAQARGLPQALPATSPPRTRSGTRSRPRVGNVYEFDAKSTYIQEPPFFTNFSHDARRHRADHRRARARHLRRLGHHRPHLARPARSRRASPAGKFLVEQRRRRSRTSTATARAAATTAS